MNTLNINVQMLEPEAAIPDQTGAPDLLVTNTLLYSIAISLKKIREHTENLNIEVSQEIIRRIHNL